MMKNLRGNFVALAEIMLGAVAVIAHNVYHILPNEVPFLVLILLDLAPSGGGNPGRR